MYILILITTLYSSAIHTDHIEFQTLSLCQNALKKAESLNVGRERYQGLYVTGVCVKQDIGAEIH